MTTTPMLPRERCDFSAIVDRPPLKLPGDARLVFWTIVNYEVWDIGRPMPRTSTVSSTPWSGCDCGCRGRITCTL